MSEDAHAGGADDASRTEWPYVDGAHPVEEGGPVARSGFNYQDEIAVSILLDMLEDPSILKVHCETHDDILVVRAPDESEERCAEYVQVKASQPDNLWSIADLCAISREERVQTRRARILSEYDDELQTFLDFVLLLYTSEGVGELD